MVVFGVVYGIIPLQQYNSQINSLALKIYRPKWPHIFQKSFSKNLGNNSLILNIDKRHWTASTIKNGNRLNALVHEL